MLNYAEEDGRGVWQTGKAVFMRNWPYAWSLAQAADSPIKGKVGVSALPAGAGGRRAATLGGWQLAVSKYSKHVDAAAALVMYLTSAEIQKQRAIGGSYNPTIPALYKDPDVARRQPVHGRAARRLHQRRRPPGQRHRAQVPRGQPVVLGRQPTTCCRRRRAAPTAVKRLEGKLRAGQAPRLVTLSAAAARAPPLAPASPMRPAARAPPGCCWRRCWSLMALVAGWPLARSIWFSFTETNINDLSASTFVGLGNYVGEFGLFGNAYYTDGFWASDWGISIRNTFVFAIVSVLLETLAGLGVALLLNQEFKGRALVRTAVLVPWAIPTIVSAKMWGWMLHDQFGVINQLLVDWG